MNIKITSFFCAIPILLFVLLAGFYLFLNDNNKALSAQRNETINNEILFKFKDFDENFLIKLTNEKDLEPFIAYLSNRKDIEFAEENFIYNASIIPSDTYYSRQWYLEKIKATKAWDITRGANDIVIAILDSGVQISHPDLRDNIWNNQGEISENSIDDDKNGFIDDKNGWDFVNNVYDPSPKFKDDFTEAGILHGTVVAGIAAASGNNATGITGVSWNSKIMPLKVLDDDGEGKTSNVIKAIDYAIANNADIINLSFVGFGFSQGLELAIKRAYDAGIIIVSAAGNEQDEGSGFSLDDTPMYPACHDGDTGENWVIGVAATDTLDEKADFSSFGHKCVDISAPGISVYSTVVYSPENKIDGKIFNKYYDGYWAGTSMATPMVSAAIALIGETNPNLSRDQVIEILLSSADNINRLNPDYTDQLGSGRLNIYNALVKARNKKESNIVNLLTSPNSNHKSLIRITNEEGISTKEFNTYADNFLGGVNLTSGDVDGDGNSEIITGTGFGGGPHVRIFDKDGGLVGQFFAYASHFRGGVNVSSCDVDGDGIEEIITGAGFTGGPHVRIFDVHGRVKGQFFAYNKNFRGGVNVACGDVDGDGENEIVTGSGKTGGPQVRIFNSRGEVEGQFFAYNKNFRGGVRVAVGDMDGGARNKKVEIITSPGIGGGPHIRIFDNFANVKKQFFAYNKNFRGGVDVASGDIDNDGLDEIITGAGPGGAPHVRVFELDGELLGSFYAYDDEFEGGVNVGFIKN